MSVTRVRRVEGNLPLDLTSFVGRRRELAEVRRLLSVARMVTLTGFGGVGKTRIALRVAADVERGLRDAAWFVDLAPLRDPRLVASTVAATIGVRNGSTEWSASGLSGYLADRNMLLVLDNCEHLLEACAVLADSLMRNAPDVRILATSRQALGISGEQAFSVPPLSVPGPETISKAEATSKPDGLAQYEAVSLFLDRVQASTPAFALTVDNHRAVAELIRRLDGMPLAVELAAARVKVLAPDQILARLDDRRRLLAATSPLAPSHQRSLQATIDWSHDLCSVGEQRLWARLSVFPRDFDVDAAEEVCSGDGLAREDVLECLAGLVDKSVLETVDAGTQVRYRLAEPLREYGRERLIDAGDAHQVRRRYLAYYRDLVQVAHAEWFGERQAEWTAGLLAEHTNLRAALEFCLAEPVELEPSMAMVPAVGICWFMTGSLGEGRQFVDQILAALKRTSEGHVEHILTKLAFTSRAQIAARAVGHRDELA